MRNLRQYIRKFILESFQTHTSEPSLGDTVENINPGCKHYRSQGKVLNIRELPNDAGKTVLYQVTNNGANFSSGDVLEKTMDQVAHFPGAVIQEYTTPPPPPGAPGSPSAMGQIKDGPQSPEDEEWLENYELAEKIILAFLQSANQGIELIQYHPDKETVSVLGDIFTTIRDDIKKLTKTDEEVYAFNPHPGLKTHQLVDHVLDELKGWDIFHMAGWEDWMPKPKDAEKVLEQFRSDVYQTFTNHWFKDLPEEKQQEWIDWVGGDL